MFVGSHPTCHHHTRVDAKMQGQVGSPFSIEFSQGSLHPEGGTQGPLRIILMDGWSPKERHDPVSVKFIHCAAILSNHRHQAFKTGVDQVTHDLWIHLLREGRKPSNIREEDGDKLAFPRHSRVNRLYSII